MRRIGIIRRVGISVIIALLIESLHPIALTAESHCTSLKKLETNSQELFKYRSIVFDNRKKISNEEDVFKILEEVVYAEVDKEKNCYLVVTKNNFYGVCMIEYNDKGEEVFLKDSVFGKNIRTTIKFENAKTGRVVDFEEEITPANVFINPNKNENYKIFVSIDNTIHAMSIIKNNEKVDDEEYPPPPYKFYTIKIEFDESINLEKAKICSDGSEYYLYDEEKMKMVKLNVSDK